MTTLLQLQKKFMLIPQAHFNSATGQPIKRWTPKKRRTLRRTREHFDMSAVHTFVVIQDEPDGTTSICEPPELHDSFMLGSVIAFTQDVFRSTHLLKGAYLGYRGRAIPLPLGVTLRRLLRVPPDMLLDKFHEHAAHPFVGAYIRAMERVRTDRIASLLGEPAQIVADFAHALQTLHAELHTPDMRKLVKNFRRTSAKCYQGLIEMMESIVSRHSRVLSLRLDLSYRSANPNFGLTHVSMREAKNHLAKFLVYLRRKTGLKILGYSWAMEYTPTTGCHFHMWLLLNGHEHQDAIGIGYRLGEAWRTITEGEGRHYVCNRNLKRYAHLAVGMLHRASHDRVGIHHIARYLTKPDYYIQYRPKDGGRTFGRSCT